VTRIFKVWLKLDHSEYLGKTKKVADIKDSRSVHLSCKAYPTVKVDAKVVKLKLKHGLALLVYFSELARKSSRTQMAELLWPDAPMEIARARLRRLCHNINAALGFEVLVGDADSLWVSESAGSIGSDVSTARRCAHQLLTSPTDPASRESLEHLLASDSHRILDGFVLDADTFSDWLDDRRNEQERLVMRALSFVGEHLCASGQPGLAAEAASRAVTIEPLADMGHALLLTARSQLGDAAGVEAAYFACAELLRQELGIRPSTLIEAAYQDALAQLAARPGQHEVRTGGPPNIKFADTTDGSVAYLELGSGPSTFVILFGLWSHIEVAWEEPKIRAILDRLALRHRVVLVDRRGTGLSERIPLEQAQQRSLKIGVEDVDAVRRALGVEQVWLLGNSVGGAIAIEYASVFSAHVTGLILYAASARGTWAPDYPWALTDEQLEKWLLQIQTSWGRATSLEQFAPSMVNDEAVRNWWARMLRQSTSRKSMSSLFSGFRALDVRARLPQLKVPTLVLQRHGDRIVREGAARYLASQIVNARLVIQPGEDHSLWYGDTPASIDEMERFVDHVQAMSSHPIASHN
jgi:pimeloyl-ACP methyl ester carboxylesterase/DNA-binding SARP family transcriptional activator